MHEDVLTGLRSNEAEPFFIVEPLNLATGHTYSLLSNERISGQARNNNAFPQGVVLNRFDGIHTPRTVSTIIIYDDLVKLLFSQSLICRRHLEREQHDVPAVGKQMIVERQ
jgi:hypothetical protein